MTESQPQQPAQTTPPARPAPKASPFRPVIFVAVLILGLAAVVAISKYLTPPELIKWRADLAQAQTDAKSSNKPILLYFTAEWCGPCQQMRRSVWTDQQVADAADRFIPVRIDVDKQPELAKQYNITAMPTFFQIGADGHKGRQQTGAMDSDQTIAWLKPATN